MDFKNVIDKYNGILLNLKKKKKEIPPYVITRINLSDIILSEISQSQRNKHCMISLIHEVSKTAKFIKTKSKMMVARD